MDHLAVARAGDGADRRLALQHQRLAALAGERAGDGEADHARPDDHRVDLRLHVVSPPSSADRSPRHEFARAGAVARGVAPALPAGAPPAASRVLPGRQHPPPRWRAAATSRPRRVRAGARARPGADSLAGCIEAAGRGAVSVAGARQASALCPLGGRARPAPAIEPEGIVKGRRRTTRGGHPAAARPSGGRSVPPGAGAATPRRRDGATPTSRRAPGRGRGRGRPRSGSASSGGARSPA